MARYILTKTFRTKSEAKEAVKKGETLHVMNNETGKVYDQANGGPFPIQGKLDHYKEWFGDAFIEGGKIYRIK